MTDIFARAIDMIYRNPNMGRAAQYVEGEAEAVECSVIVSHDLTQWGDTIQVQNGMAMIAVRRNEIDSRPRRGGIFTLGSGQQYQVERVMISDEYEHRCLTTDYVEPEEPEAP